MRHSSRAFHISGRATRPLLSKSSNLKSQKPQRPPDFGGLSLPRPPLRCWCVLLFVQSDVARLYGHWMGLSHFHLGAAPDAAPRATSAQLQGTLGSTARGRPDGRTVGAVSAFVFSAKLTSLSIIKDSSPPRILSDTQPCAVPPPCQHGRSIKKRTIPHDESTRRSLA